MGICTAGFETGTNGATIATTDVGNGTPWSAVGIAAAPGAATYDNSVAHTRVLCALLTGGPSGNTELTWSTPFGTQTDHYGRFYMWIASNPAASKTALYHRNSSTFAVGIRITSAGKLTIYDGSTDRATTTNAVTTSAWVRVEYHAVHDTVNGSMELKLFNSPESTTPTETISASTFNSRASATDAKLVGPTGSYSIRFDDVIVGASAYPGPTGNSIVWDPKQAARRNMLLRRCSGILVPRLWLPNRGGPLPVPA